MERKQREQNINSIEDCVIKILHKSLKNKIKDDYYYRYHNRVSLAFAKDIFIYQLSEMNERTIYNLINTNSNNIRDRILQKISSIIFDLSSQEKELRIRRARANIALKNRRKAHNERVEKAKQKQILQEKLRKKREILRKQEQMKRMNTTRSINKKLKNSLPKNDLTKLYKLFPELNYYGKK